MHHASRLQLVDGKVCSRPLPELTLAAEMCDTLKSSRVGVVQWLGALVDAGTPLVGACRCEWCAGEGLCDDRA